MNQIKMQYLKYQFKDTKAARDYREAASTASEWFMMNDDSERLSLLDQRNIP